MADGSEKRIDGVALLVGEIVAAHPMIVLEVPEYKPDGRTPRHHRSFG